MSFHNSFLLLCSLVTMSFTFPATSQERTNLAAPQDTTELSDEIEEIKVTAFRAPYNLFNTPAPINLIEPVQLTTGDAFSPVEALNQVPGILMHHATLSTNRLTIRGIGTRSPYATNKIKAYFGEIPLTSGDGETTVEDLENPTIKKVEIIKGPSSSLYGAGLGGTLLFHPQTVGNNFIQHQTTVASFNTYKNTLSAGIHEQNLSVYLLGSILNSQGFRENNSTNRSNIMLHSEYRITENMTLGALVRLTRMKAYIPSSVSFSTYLNHPEQAAANWKAIQGYEAYDKGQLGLSLTINPDSRNKISAAAFGSFRDADEPRPFNLLLETSKYGGGRGYYQHVISGGLFATTLTTGFEIFRETYNWSTWSNENTQQSLSDNRERRSYENLFIQGESSFQEKLYLSAGINANITRFDYIDNFLGDGDKSGKRSYNPVLSPRVGFNLRMLDELSFFGNVSHGFSTPTFEETLLPEGQINPDIKPETGWNFEAGIRTGISNRLMATISYYRIYINNLLVARRTGEDAYVGVNAGESLHPGLEAEFRWQVFSPGTFPSLNINGNTTLANYHFRDFIDNDMDYSGNLLPGTTKTTWLLAGDFQPASGYGIRAWHRYTGKMPVNDANSAYTDPFGITNIEFRHNRKINALVLELKAGVQNVFDVHHAAMLAVNAPAFGNTMPRYYYPGNPRNYFISILLGWSAN